MVGRFSEDLCYDAVKRVVPVSGDAASAGDFDLMLASRSDTGLWLSETALPGTMAGRKRRQSRTELAEK